MCLGEGRSRDSIRQSSQGRSSQIWTASDLHLLQSGSNIKEHIFPLVISPKTHRANNQKSIFLSLRIEVDALDPAELI